MTFYQNVGLTIFHQTVASPLTCWIHNDFMYVRFGRMRYTETWSKSRSVCLLSVHAHNSKTIHQIRLILSYHVGSSKMVL